MTRERQKSPKADGTARNKDVVTASVASRGHGKDEQKDRALPVIDSETSVPSEYSEPVLEPAMAINDRHTLILMSLLGSREADDHPPLARKMFDEIVIDIVEGRLQPGESMNSVELARRFGTSRTPIREGLAALERQGIVIVPPRRRPYVATITLQQIKELYDLRANLFGLVSELIVDTCPSEKLSELRKWQEALEKDAIEQSVDNYFWHNVGFRLVEAKLSGSRMLQRSIGAIGIRTLQFRRLSLSQPGRLKRSVQDHNRLIIAYEERDKATAVGMTRALIMSGFRAIEQSGLFRS